jgi:hypothetical protein
VSNKTVVEKTLIIHVPDNQQTVNVRLEIETNCTCSPNLSSGAGSYIDMEGPATLNFQGPEHDQKNGA